MRRRYFGWEQAFESIWNETDDDGIWNGDVSRLAEEFSVPEDAAESILVELCDRRLIENVAGTYFVVNWRERDNPVEENEPS